MATIMAMAKAMALKVDKNPMMRNIPTNNSTDASKLRHKFGKRNPSFRHNFDQTLAGLFLKQFIPA